MSRFSYLVKRHFNYNTFMVAEDLHAWLCVGVISRLEAEFGYAWKGRKQLIGK